VRLVGRPARSAINRALCSIGCPFTRMLSSESSRQRQHALEQRRNPPITAPAWGQIAALMRLLQRRMIMSGQAATSAPRSIPAAVSR